MKKTVPFLALLVLIGLIPTEASAWYCRATSPTGSWGWGRSDFRGAAVSIALNNCSVRTPYGYYCHLRYCSPYQ